MVDSKRIWELCYAFYLNADPLNSCGNKSLMMLVENGVMMDWHNPITIRMTHCCQKFTAIAVVKKAVENIKVETAKILSLSALSFKVLSIWFAKCSESSRPAKVYTMVNAGPEIMEY